MNTTTSMEVEKQTTRVYADHRIGQIEGTEDMADGTKVEGTPAFEEINQLFRKYGLDLPPRRLRDTLADHLLSHRAKDKSEEIAGEAYQVIGALADAGGLFETPEVQLALDYFSNGGDGEILPWVAPKKQ